MKNLYLSIILLISISNIHAQNTFHIVGNDSIQNTNATYPSIYGNYYKGVKNQFLVLASEMQAAGMYAGNINGIAFDLVTTSGSSLTNFQIEMKSTSQTLITSWDNNNLTTHFGPLNYTDQIGWNQHDFISPFYWDGVSNILIKTCFYNTTWGNNAIMNMSNYSYNTLIFRRRNNDPCTSNWINGIESNRPNIRFQLLDINAPPISDFSVNSNVSCDGTVIFNDLSSNYPTSWFWDFGDGATSNLQNPSHNYGSSGSYDVQLISYNAFGSDTTIFPNFIQVNIINNIIPATCFPLTISNPNQSANFGITNFNFGSISKASSGGDEGYSDFTCDSSEFTVGKFYQLSAVHSSPIDQNFSAWVDYNNNGTFEVPSEQITSNISSDSTSTNIFIPNINILNTPLRLRIMADISFAGSLDPCTDPIYGQAEDYTVYLVENNQSPSNAFECNENYSCDGIIQFNDLTENFPVSWYWDFGDGNSSVLQNPIHTYSNSGVFDITLITSNSFGSDTVTYNQFIEVDTTNFISSSAYNPVTLNYCCQYGIERVIFENINHLSMNAEEGYMDFSCENQANLDQNNNYTLKVYNSGLNNQDTKAWIDYNSNGVFESSEMVMEKLNSYDPTQIVQIPSNTSNEPIRLRISSDEVGNNNGPLDDVVRGQVEDYGVLINQQIPNSITQNKNGKVLIYPNPAREKVNIEIINFGGEIKKELYDLIGNLITKTNKTTIDLQYLSKGVYLLELEYNNTIEQLKLIIE